MRSSSCSPLFVVWVGLFAIISAAVTPRITEAVIQVLIPLQALINDSDQVFVARVDKIDPERPSVVLVAGDNLKGKAAFVRLPVNLTGDKEKHTPQLLKRLGPELPIIVFVKQEGPKKHMALAFTNGTWFQMLGEADGEQTRWAFTHCEIYLRRTFKGTTAELQSIVTDVVAGKRKAPAPNPKEPAGLGPEVATK